MFNYLKANLFNDLFMSLKKILNLAFLLLKYFSDGFFFSGVTSTNYSRVAGAWLRLHSEELLKEYPVGFDPRKGFAEMDKHKDVENVVAIEIQVLDAVAPE
jgi:hypothetical protein